MPRIAVIGAGTMGNGIAQVFAGQGNDVILVDVQQAALDKGMKAIEGSLARVVKKGTLTEADAAVTLKRIALATDLAVVKDAALVVEAASEDPAIKFKIFESLDALCGPATILATNTSSISITEIAGKTKRPEQVIGMHFMNPVPVMALVEIIRGAATSDATYAATKALAEKMGKTTVVSKDFPGFIVNRVLIPMLNEACFAVMEGLASVEDIDTAMKLGTNQPMGPLALADFIGLDTVLSIAQVLHAGLGESKYRPCPLLRQYVEAGWLGKKTGRGFYKY